MASLANDIAMNLEKVTEMHEHGTTFLTAEEDQVDVEVVPYAHRIVVVVCFCLFTLIGLLGNALVIASVIISRKLRTTTNILVVNLAVADFLTCASFPFQVVGLVNSSGDYPLPEIVCKVLGGVLVHGVCVSTFTLSAIAFLRWYVITKSIRGHRGLHTPLRVTFLVVIIWTVSLVILIVNHVLGIAELGYSTYYRLCLLLDSSPRIGYSLTVGMILINLVVIAIFYALTLRFLLRHSRKIRTNLGDGSAPAPSDTSGCPGNRGLDAALRKREIEITKNLFVVVCIFVLCYVSYCIHILIWGFRVFGLYSGVILTANSTVNPIIYGLRHPNFREVFRRIIRSSINRVSNQTSLDTAL